MIYHFSPLGYFPFFLGFFSISKKKKKNTKRRGKKKQKQRINLLAQSMETIMYQNNFGPRQHSWHTNGFIYERAICVKTWNTKGTHGNGDYWHFRPCDVTSLFYDTVSQLPYILHRRKTPRESDNNSWWKDRHKNMTQMKAIPFRVPHLNTRVCERFTQRPRPEFGDTFHRDFFFFFLTHLSVTWLQLSIVHFMCSFLEISDIAEACVRRVLLTGRRQAACLDGGVMFRVAGL